MALRHVCPAGAHGGGRVAAVAGPRPLPRSGGPAAGAGVPETGGPGAGHAGHLRGGDGGHPRAP
eukprot:9235462-Pyramimonas_sp.AAC.1